MSLLLASRKGLELIENDGRATPVDFVSTGGGYTLVALVEWWRLTRWTIGMGLYRFMDTPIPRGSSWALAPHRGAAALQPISFTTTYARWRHARIGQDTDREAYLTALRQCATQFPEQDDILPWLEDFSTRPTLDAAAQFRKQHTAPRAVGILPLHGTDGALIDALAIDLFGSAEPARGDAWLQSIASQWVFFEGDRPELQPFLEWAANQRPHGPTYPGTPQVVTTQGSTKRIAAQALAGIL